MNKKIIEDSIPFLENIYNPSIVSIFEKERESLRPFIVLDIDGVSYFITNKKNFFKIVDKYKNKLKKISIEKGWIVFYLEEKVVKYEIIPTTLKIKKI